MGQFVMFPSIKRRLAKAEQVVIAVREKTDAFLSRGSAIKVDQIVTPGHEESSENAHVKVGAACRIAVSELGPAEIALVF